MISSQGALVCKPTDGRRRISFAHAEDDSIDRFSHRVRDIALKDDTIEEQDQIENGGETNSKLSRRARSEQRRASTDEEFLADAEMDQLYDEVISADRAKSLVDIVLTDAQMHRIRELDEPRKPKRNDGRRWGEKTVCGAFILLVLGLLAATIWGVTHAVANGTGTKSSSDMTSETAAPVVVETTADDSHTVNDKDTPATINTTAPESVLLGGTSQDAADEDNDGAKNEETITNTTAPGTTNSVPHVNQTADEEGSIDEIPTTTSTTRTADDSVSGVISQSAAAASRTIPVGGTPGADIGDLLLGYVEQPVQADEVQFLLLRHNLTENTVHTTTTDPILDTSTATTVMVSDYTIQCGVEVDQVSLTLMCVRGELCGVYFVDSSYCDSWL